MALNVQQKIVVELQSSVPRLEVAKGEQDRVQSSQECVQEKAKTYDNQTGEIQ